MIDNVFFVVWNPDHGLPRCRHSTENLAEAEARRLAGLHPGQSFYIMQATKVARRDDPVSVHVLDDIPF